MNVALAFVGVLAAFACALADSAGLRGAIDAGQALPRADEEARHRALLFGRVVGHLCAGVGAARALGGAIDRPWALWLAVAACALVAVAVGEAAARELGDALGALGPRAAARVAGVGRAAEVALAPVLWPAARLDAALRRRFRFRTLGAPEVPAERGGYKLKRGGNCASRSDSQEGPLNGGGVDVSKPRPLSSRRSPSSARAPSRAPASVAAAPAARAPRAHRSA